MTKSEIALELTKLAMEKSLIYTSDSSIEDIANSEKAIFNMFIKDLKIYDSGNSIPDSE